MSFLLSVKLLSNILNNIVRNGLTQGKIPMLIINKDLVTNNNSNKHSHTYYFIDFSDKTNSFSLS
jgi:hypothetical protein